MHKMGTRPRSAASAASASRNVAAPYGTFAYQSLEDLAANRPTSYSRTLSSVERSTASAAYSFVRFVGGAAAPYLAGKLGESINVHVPFWVGAACTFVAIGVLASGRTVLAHVDDDGAARGEPELAVLVVRQSDGLPGQGWWVEGARQHGFTGLWEGPKATKLIRKLQSQAFDYWANRHCEER